MTKAAGLDHAVVNVLRGMEPAATIFTALGFTLTPLGRHSLGSINHLMMTPGAYLELVGVPETGKQRQEVLDSPEGLSGLVFKTDDANATFARLEQAGLKPSAPVAFSRPVEIDGETLEARFRTVRVPGEFFPAGRVYFCEHLTPELVWREEWLAHPNGFVGLNGITVASADPEADAKAYAAAAEAEVDATKEGLRITLSDFAIDIVAGERARFVSLALSFDGLDRIAAYARDTEGAWWDEPMQPGPSRLILRSIPLTLYCRSVR